MITIAKYPIGYLNEIFQSLEIRFAFLVGKDEKYKQINNPVKCRDFLGDFIWSKKKETTASIYGQVYSYKDAPFEERQLQLSLTFPNIEALTNFKNNIGYLHKKETSAKTQLTVVKDTDDALTLAIFSDKIWQSCMWKMSLFSYYLKVISYPNEAELKHPELSYKDYLTTAKEKILLAKVHDDVEYLYDDIHSAHNRHGFVSIIKGLNINMHNYLLKGITL